MAYVVQLNQPKQVEVRDYRTPEPRPGDVRARTLYSGISAGTELATYRGTNPYLERGTTSAQQPVDQGTAARNRDQAVRGWAHRSAAFGQPRHVRPRRRRGVPVDRRPAG